MSPSSLKMSSCPDRGFQTNFHNFIDFKGVFWPRILSISVFRINTTDCLLKIAAMSNVVLNMIRFLKLLDSITFYALGLRTKTLNYFQNLINIRNGSRWHKIKLSAGLYSFLEILGENLFSCFVQLSEASRIPWLLACHFILKASNDW